MTVIKQVIRHIFSVLYRHNEKIFVFYLLWRNSAHGRDNWVF